MIRANTRLGLQARTKSERDRFAMLAYTWLALDPVFLDSFERRLREDSNYKLWGASPVDNCCLFTNMRIHAVRNMMKTLKINPVTDICVFVQDVEKAIDFYTQKLGLTLRSRNEGFADFWSENIILAAWERKHMSGHTGISNTQPSPGMRQAAICVRLPEIADVDRLYTVLSQRGVEFLTEPSNYPWKARCAYFSDQDYNLWELYAWIEGKL